MKLRCLIVDDKPLAIDLIVNYVHRTPFLELVATTGKPLIGLQIIKEENIDLVFLDIQMPELSGFEFIRMAGRPCITILTTAYSEFALEGYEHNALDYLLKPFSFERFYRAAEKAFTQKQSAGPIQSEQLISASTPVQTFIFLKTSGKIKKINLDDILFIEGLQNYLAVHTIQGKILSLQTLKSILSQLPAHQFCRVHKSFIIALKQIESIKRGRILIGSRLIPIGDIYREGFLNIIGPVRN